MVKLAKRKNDEIYTPIILIEPIIKHLEKWAMDFTQKNKREPVVLCPFDLIESEFVRMLKQKWTVKYGHIETGEDFFTYNYGDCDICISNPPFNLKKKYLKDYLN